MKIHIDANCPEYRGARMPMFDPLKVNESEFEDELRFKEFDATFDPRIQEGLVYWLSQESNEFTEAAKNELIRAFKANGAKRGAVIEVDFGIRDEGINQHFDIEIE